MYILNESEKEYRTGDAGPKYLMKGPNANFGVVIIKAGEHFNNHKHNIMEENFFILEGAIDFYIDDAVVEAKVGDFIHVDPGESHFLLNKGTIDAKAVFCLAPFQTADKVELENPDYK